MSNFLCILSVLSATLAMAAEVSSPRLELLRAEMQRDPRAVARFWREVRVAGTPLVEQVPGDDANVLVTFLWRGSADHSNVIVFANIFPDNSAARQTLYHLPGTDVWHRTYRLRRDLPILYELSPNGLANLQRDPLNPHFVEGSMGGSAVILPGNKSQQWSRPDSRKTTRGKVEQTTIRSERLNNQRSVTVYLPANYRPDRDYGLLLVLDEDVYSGPVALATILDNLIAAREIPPLIAILIGNIDRANELSCSSEFSAFLATELVPAMEQRYAFRRSGERSTILGSSFGGLAAACAGIQEAEHFGAVIALSASFRWRPQGDPEPEWLARHLAVAPVLPVRFFIGAGSTETGTPNEPGNPSLLTASRHVRDVLRARGYAITYREFPGAHDPLSWTAALPDFLRDALGHE